MPARITDNRAESVVATVWLAFYGLAIGVAVTSFLALDAIEVAAR